MKKLKRNKKVTPFKSSLSKESLQKEAKELGISLFQQNKKVAN